MKRIVFYSSILLINLGLGFVGCNYNKQKTEIPILEKKVPSDTTLSIIDISNNYKTTEVGQDTSIQISKTDSIVAFAKTLLGTPYLYASTNPAEGLDCSGFITYVYSHFNVLVPRSSIDFTNYGKDVAIDNAIVGNLILFTGTDSISKVVGHMGIITENSNGQIKFIHSTSGKANGVTITPLNEYYKKRFVKIIALP